MSYVALPDDTTDGDLERVKRTAEMRFNYQILQTEESQMECKTAIASKRCPPLQQPQIVFFNVNRNVLSFIHTMSIDIF